MSSELEETIESESRQKFQESDEQFAQSTSSAQSDKDAALIDDDEVNDDLNISSEDLIDVDE